MADQPDEGFLPPEPPGPEPELGKRPDPPLPPHQPPPAGWGQQPAAGPQAPAGQGWPAQQPQQQWTPPPQQGYPPQQGWQHPPPPGWQQPGWPRPIEPDNGPAVTGFVLAMVSIGLWVLSAGLSTLISLGLAIAGLFVSRTGKRNVSEGKTSRNKGLAQAGFIASIVMIVLSALSTAAWTAVFVLYATDEDFRRDFENDNDSSPFDSDGIETSVRLGVIAVRITAHLLS